MAACYSHYTRAKGRRNLKSSTSSPVQTGTHALIWFHGGLHRAAVSCSHPTHFHIAVWNHSLVDGRICPVSIVFLSPQASSYPLAWHWALLGRARQEQLQAPIHQPSVSACTCISIRSRRRYAPVCCSCMFSVSVLKLKCFCGGTANLSPQLLPILTYVWLGEDIV